MADNAKITLNVGMDRKDFFNGAKDIQNAIKSLQSSVVSMGREIRTAAGGYGTAMIQSAKASKDFEGSVQGIKAKIQELSTSIASIKASADSFRTYSKSIESAELEMGKLLEKQNELRNAGANLPSDEWQQNQENIEKTNAQLAIWEKNYYRFLEKYNEAVERINTGMTADGSKQLTKGEISTYTQSANINADYVNEISDKIEEAQGKLEEFKQAEADLIAQGKNLPSDEWQQLQDQIDQAQNRIVEMRDIQDNMRKAGYENADRSDEYKDQVQRLKELQGALDRTKQVKDEALKPPYIRGWENMTRLSAMITEGFGRIQYAAGTLKTAIQHPIQAADRALGTLIASAGRAASSLAKMAGNAALSFLRNIASTAMNAAIQLAKIVSNAVISGLGRLASAAKNAVVQLVKLTGGAIRTGIAKLGSAIGQAAKKLLGLDKSARRANKGLGASLKTVLKYAFGVRSMFFLFRRLRQAFSDGIGEIAKKNPELQAALNGLQKAFSALKGSIASAFAPIVTVVAPALTMLINMLTGAMNAVGAFFAALTGKTSYQKSVGKVGSTAAKSAKDVEKLNRQLADFDHLNILTDKDKNDSSGSNGTDSGLAYETVPIDKSILDFVQQIKDLWAAEDFEGIGALFAEKINGIFEKIDEAISWDNVGEKITKAINAITGIINGLIYNIDWALIGKTIGDGINTLIKSFNLFATSINWYALGKGIADGLNSLIDTVNWDELGQALANRMNIVIWTMYGVISNFDFSAAGAAFAEMVNSFFDYVDWDLLGQTLYKLFGGVLDFIYKAVTGIDWDKVISRFVGGFNTFVSGMRQKFVEFKSKAEEMGRTFGDAINKIFGKVNWEELGGMLADGLKLAIGFLKDAILTIEWGTAGEDLAASIDSFINDVDWDGIGETINGEFQGILDFVQAALDYFKENDTATELGNKIRDMLGKIQWGEIATKTWNAIKSAFSLAGSFLDALFSEKVDSSKISGQYFKEVTEFNAKPLGERMAIKIKGVFEAIPWKDIAETTWNGIKEAFKVAGDFVATLLDAESSDPKDIGDAVGKKLAEIPWKTIFDEAKETVLGFAEGAIGELANSENGDGKILLAVAGAIAGLKIGIPLLIKGLSTAVTASIGVMGLAIFDAFLIAYDVKKINEIISGTEDVVDTHKERIKNALSTYSQYVEAGNKDVADKFAELVVGIDTTNMSADQAMQALKEALVQDAADTYGVFIGSLEEGNAELVETAQTRITESGRDVAAAYLEAGQSVTDSYYEGIKARAQQTDDVAAVFSDTWDFIIDNADAEAKGGSEAEQFYSGFKNTVLDGKGGVKEEFVDALNGIFEPAEIEALASGEMSIEDFMYAFELGSKTVGGDATKAFSDLFTSIYGSVDSSATGDQYANDVFTAFKTKIMDNGKVKEKYKAAFEQIFGSVDGLEDGSLTAKQFFDGWNNGVKDNTDPSVKAVEDAMAEVILGTNNTLGIASPSTVAAEMAKYFLEGFAEGAENNQDSAQKRVSTVFQTISDAVSNVVSGVKSFFSKIFGGGKKEEDTGVSADDVAKPYEEGAERAKTALNNLNTDTRTALSGFGEYFTTLAKTATKAFDDIDKSSKESVENIKTDSKTNLDEVNKAFADTFDAVKKGLSKNYSDIIKNVQQSMQQIYNTNDQTLRNIKEKVFQPTLTSIKDTVVKAMDFVRDEMKSKTDDTKTTVSDNISEMHKNVVSDITQMSAEFIPNVEAIQDSGVSAFNDITEAIEEYGDASDDSADTFDSAKEEILSGIRAIREAASDMRSFSSEMYSALRNAYYEMMYVDFAGVGENIVNGIIHGINNGWPWLRNTVQSLAQAAYNAAKAALGIHSPSRVFRDGVGKQMIAGMTVGMEDAEPNMLKTIGSIAQNAADEMADSKITANVGANTSGIVDGLDEVLSGFSDKVTNSFSAMIDKLSAIASSVTFREPSIAAGTTLPYSVSGNSTNDSKAAVEAQKASNEDLISSMIQLVNNQTSALVQAIQQYGGTTVNLDVHSLTDAIVNEINRRTRTNGKSPLLT